MKYSLVMAISVSILLIGIASWSRFINRDTASADLIAVNSYSNQNYEDFLNDFLPSESGVASSTTPAKETLSSTEIISRGLITDYINLSLSGQVSGNDVTNLVNQYVNIIPKLTQKEIITSANITIVADTQENSQIYANQVDNIYTKYSATFNNIAVAQGESYDQAFQNEITSMGNTYKNLASELTKVRVPGRVTTYHIQLVNTYLMNVDALKAISDVEKDPVVALAGITAFQESLVSEKDIITKIEQILTSSGI